tara:strand:- start:2329 stop:2478 length:150 start_codon:yes stop_codon:yes gene_type:complete
MIKAIHKIEVPVYLLALGVGCMNNGQDGLGTFLIIISLVRLWINWMKDE